MVDINLLKSEFSTVMLEANALQAKQLGGSISEDEGRKLSSLTERALGLQQLIDEENVKSRNADLSKLNAWTQDPNYKVARNINNDDDGRKALIGGGWEFKGGRVFVPTSQGKTVEMYNEEVLFGPIPQDPDVSAYFKKIRTIVQPEYRNAYTKFIRNCGKFRSESMALNNLEPHEQKALSEGNDQSGGYLVPPDLHAEVLVRLAQQSVMRRLARVVTTSRDRIAFPRVAPNSDSNLESIYSSGFVGGWVGETPAFSDTDPAFGLFEVSVKKLRVATKLSNDFVNDAIIDVPAWLAMNGAENLALVEDAGFITGDGTPLQPLGFLNDANLKTADVEGSTSNTISNTTSSNGSANKLIALTYALPSQYAARAEWLMRRSIEGKIRVLVDGAGRYLWPAMIDSGFVGRGSLPPLMGAPLNNSEFMPADGSDANKVVAYGDFSQYIIAQRAQLSTIILRERFADVDQLGIILMERVGGALWNHDAIRVGIV